MDGSHAAPGYPRDGCPLQAAGRQDVDGAGAAVGPAGKFLEFIGSDRFPCVGSRLALAQDTIATLELGTLGSARNDAPLLDRLERFAEMVDAGDPEDPAVHSLVALFRGPAATDEPRFEALLWGQLQRLHELDADRGRRWAPDVSSDPDSSKFSMSLGGHPFFVIGLHAGASRIARRFPWPTLVFNSHRQFERLRGDGRFAKMQGATRARDRKLQGSINPNLSDYGEASEARQYSGRAVEQDWRCPFHARRAA
ncbi:guanitoxin biosynthesis heme-dependent pre-guanitoxin N-hydroxylase GntA [Luteimonas sp. RD2P54]|uniref:Guanitoxin biosynthesis heme-dependent pre-guanitoxin N-hydroxylase GntA n=1 Tax=Luteimonas endophytica TaxID=3042023 RepID=A0ABT6JCY6_9GAMM|nr:guanitoxin biosynthesis heme-dependent pre-guanitoxin N-hydroxylase GntA [Luteimonas endophytica]MDH5824068.1 guanitoxin biosynthesis heme-dependent pre-guanitoxin N-hydroxylase GntA [Luteimonas endophytica]